MLLPLVMKRLRMPDNLKHSAMSKRLCMLTASFALATLFYFRLYIWHTEDGAQRSREIILHDPNAIEEEWEWARNTSIVYTWVNGSDIRFRAQQLLNGGKEDGAGSRDRDNDELLYSLRSLSKYLPWHTGNIYIVTQNQVPAWLNVSNPRIHIVDHSTIIPGKYLPTYNSNVIDSYLHLIPGLTDMFLYFNDDVFIHSPLHPSDIFTADYGLKLFVDRFTIPLNKTKQMSIINGVKDTAYWQAFFGTVQLLENTFGEKCMKPLRILQHTSHMFHRGAIEQMHLLWAKEFQGAHINKFREDNDIVFVYAYYGYLVHHGWACCNLNQETFQAEGQGDRITFINDTNLNSKTIEKLRQQRKPMFLNVNDNMGPDATADDSRKQLATFLIEEFGKEKSPFEL